MIIAPTYYNREYARMRHTAVVIAEIARARAHVRVNVTVALCSTSVFSPSSPLGASVILLFENVGSARLVTEQLRGVRDDYTRVYCTVVIISRVRREVVLLFRS